MKDDIPASYARLTRRELIRRLAGGAGGAFCTGIGPLAPMDKHLGLIHSHLATTASKLLFLDGHQSETLTILAERIIPNSGRAQVNRIIDLLLSVDTVESQKRLTDALSAMDQESAKHFGKPFKAISETQQNELLIRASADVNAGKQDRTASTKAELPLYDHFENLKGWVSTVYYSTEEGMRELGWTGNHFFDRYVGCEHPEGHS